MVVVNAIGLNLRGNAVLTGGVADRAQSGKRVATQPPALPIQRHLSRCLSFSEPDAPLDRADYRDYRGGMGHAALRAGRPGSGAGVPSRKPASVAGGAVLFGWSPAGGLTSTAALAAYPHGWRYRPSADGALANRPLCSTERPTANPGLIRRVVKAMKRVEQGQTGIAGMARTFAASTRGKGR
jgi:hypothetical protein